ncbi:MAG: hypothetical protein AB1531_06035 [Chloroflexota bacterium]
MSTIKKSLPILMLLILLVTSCNIPTAPGTAISGIATLPPVSAEITNLNGTWTGALTTGIFTFLITMTIEQNSDDNIIGNVTITDQLDPSHIENYAVNGVFDGAILHVQESEGRFFTATYADEALSGYIAWNCYDCPEDGWGLYTLTRDGSWAISSPVPPAVDLNGTWQGIFDEWSGASRLFDMTLIITQEAGSSEFSGSVQLILSGTIFQEYSIEGIIEGNAVRFHDTSTEEIMYYYTGIVNGDEITGNASGYCYACGADFGEFSVNR